MTDQAASPPVDVSVPATSFSLLGVKLLPFQLPALLIVVASLLIASTWTIPSINDNVASRLATAESIVERHTVQIDDSRFVGTIDKVRIDGHFYSEKPPLLSFILAGGYAVLHALGFVLWPGTAAYSILTLLIIGSSFLLCLACFYDAVRRVGLDESSATWMTSMLAFGTLCLSFNTNINNHSFPASWLFIGLYALLRATDDDRPLWMRTAGLAFALAFGADYSTALLIAPLGLYILWQPRLRRHLASVALPCAFILAASLVFNYLISGSWKFVQVHAEYFHYPGSAWNTSSEHLSGVGRNSLSFAAHYAWQMLVSRNGFLLYCPLLLFAVAAGILRIVRRRPLWQLSLAILTGCAAFVAFYSLYSTNFAGCTYSTRWFVAFIPILWFLAFPLFLRKDRWSRVALGATFGASIPIAMLGLVNPWTCAVPAILENADRWREFGPVLVNTIVTMASIVFAWSVLRAWRQAPADEDVAPPSSLWKRRRVWLGGILLLAFALRLGVALALPTADYPDEIFQAREQAHRLVYGYGVVPWQVRDGVTNWVLPELLSVVIRGSAWLGHGSLGYTFGIDFVLCLLSLACVWFGFRWGERLGGPSAAIIAGTTCALWPGLVHYSSQALTETVAAYALLPGLYFGYFAGASTGDEFAGPNSAVRQFVNSAVSGLLLGLATAFDIQLAPAVFVAAVWICRSNLRRWLAMAVGIALPLIAFGTVDAYTLGRPFASYINAFTINILHHRSNLSGKEPFYWYFAQIGKRVGPILFVLLLGCRRSWFLASIAVSVLGTQLLFAHKDYRFIFPMIPILSILVALGLALPLWQRVAGFVRRPVLGAVAVTAIASAVWGMQQDVWFNFAGPIHAGRELSLRNDVCGVATAEWIYGTGGYFYLHQDVPIFFAAERGPQETRAYNYITSPVGFEPLLPPQYQKQACWRGYCIYQRPGSCERVPGYDVNQVLRQLNR